jgi:hypothetical protein
MKLALVVLFAFLAMGAASFFTPLEHVQEGMQDILRVGTNYDRVRIVAPALRIDSGSRISFGQRESHIAGDSSSIWVSTWDGHTLGSQRVGMIADHDGISGIGVFDAHHSPLNQPLGPSANDTIRGLAHFTMRMGKSGLEFWVAYEDDSGVEREAFLGTFKRAH